jgi:thymidylate kinase
MFHIVEGLNGAGKSTFIDDNMLRPYDKLVESAWINRLRWDKKKRIAIGATKGQTESYVMGATETVFRIQESIAANIFLDRSFISSFVYDSISEIGFFYLLGVAAEYDVTVHFLDTPPEVCYQRFLNTNGKGYVAHRKLEDFEKIYKRFLWCLAVIATKYPNITIDRNRSGRDNNQRVGP